MRAEFISDDHGSLDKLELEQRLAALREAEGKAPWAAVVVSVDGGYMAFESVNDYKTWNKQK